VSHQSAGDTRTIGSDEENTCRTIAERFFKGAPHSLTQIAIFLGTEKALLAETSAHPRYVSAVKSHFDGSPAITGKAICLIQNTTGHSALEFSGAVRTEHGDETRLGSAWCRIPREYDHAFV
jgi:hypothetical protein